MSRVLVVDDDSAMRAALEARFIRRGWRVDTAASAREAMEKFRRGMHPLIVTDIRMPGEDGFFIMREAQAVTAHTAVILLTAYANIPEAVTAMKKGACDYLVKPVSFEQLEHAAERILSACRNDADQTKELIGQAPCWLRALQRARQAAATDADVLIEAESGTGKELVARLIHRLSPRRNRPFVAVNCAAFPETLLESELFGYSKGFAGARGRCHRAGATFRSAVLAQRQAAALARRAVGAAGKPLLARQCERTGQLHAARRGTFHGSGNWNEHARRRGMGLRGNRLHGKSFLPARGSVFGRNGAQAGGNHPSGHGRKPFPGSGTARRKPAHGAQQSPQLWAAQLEQLFEERNRAAGGTAEHAGRSRSDPRS
jgi:FixJ family two-component response regulator